MILQACTKLLQSKEHEVILYALLFVSIAFSFLNPLWHGGAPGFDASVFAVMGKMWASGEMLYRDMIDIKGPGIFFIDMIGYSIGGYKGIAFLETLLLSFGAISLDLALRVFRFTPLARFCSITLVISLLGLRYYYGNMTEDYAFYFAMIASYPFALLYYRQRFSLSLALVPALLFGFLTTVRVNNVSYFLAWYVMLFLYYRYNGHKSDAMKLFFSALTGLLVAWILFGIYFYVNGGWELVYEALYYSVLIFFKEGAYGSGGFNFSAGLVGFFRTGLWIVVLGFCYFLRVYKSGVFSDQHQHLNNRFWFVFYLGAGIVITVIANSVSGHIYDHYDQLFLPFMFIPIAYLMHCYLHVNSDISQSFLSILFLIVFLISEHVFWTWDNREWSLAIVIQHMAIDTLCAIVVCGSVYCCRQYIGFYRHNHTFFLCLSIGITLLLSAYALLVGIHNGQPWNEEAQQKVDYVLQNTDLEDKIWVEGDMPQYYVWTDRVTAAPYLFFRNVNPGYDVQQKILDRLRYFKPKVIIVRTRLVNEYNDSREIGVSANDFRGQVEFFKFIYTNYKEVQSGLYVLKSLVNEDELPAEDVNTFQGATNSTETQENGFVIVEQDLQTQDNAPTNDNNEGLQVEQ